MCAFLKHSVVADNTAYYELVCNTHQHMHSPKLTLSVNVFPHYFKNEWLVGRLGSFLSFSRGYSVQKYFIPMGFDFDLIKTDVDEQ